MSSIKFIKALKENDLNQLQMIEKSDYHNHATRGGNINHFLTLEEVEKLDWSSYFTTLMDMQRWYESNVKCLFNGREGFIKRVESAFRQAKEDSINPLVLSFGLGDAIHFEDDLRLFVNVIKDIKERIYPEVNFIPEVSFSRSMCPVKSSESLKEVIEFDFFKSIDLIGDESIDVISFSELFSYAKKKGLICKAHVGEFSNAENVMYVCKTLGLDEVQHGNSSVDSEEVMKFLRDNNIMLHLCPSSNLRLKRVKSLSDHPIKKLYENGIAVSINTDDMLIFNSSVSEEYLKLYNSGVLSAEELNDIRENALKRHESFR